MTTDIDVTGYFNRIGCTGPADLDVGFGGQTLSSPIRLEAGPVQDTGAKPSGSASTPPRRWWTR